MCLHKGETRALSTQWPAVVESEEDIPLNEVHNDTTMKSLIEYCSKRTKYGLEDVLSIG